MDRIDHRFGEGAATHATLLDRPSRAPAGPGPGPPHRSRLPSFVGASL